MTETEKPFLATKSFSTNLVHVLPPYHVTISNMHVCTFTDAISHVHGGAPKMVLCKWNLVYEKLLFMKACILKT